MYGNIHEKYEVFKSLTTVVEDEPGGPVYPFVSLSPGRIPDNIHRVTITQNVTKHCLIPLVLIHQRHIILLLVLQLHLI